MQTVRNHTQKNSQEAHRNSQELLREHINFQGVHGNRQKSQRNSQEANRYSQEAHRNSQELLREDIHFEGVLGNRNHKETARRHTGFRRRVVKSIHVKTEQKLAVLNYGHPRL